MKTHVALLPCLAMSLACASSASNANQAGSQGPAPDAAAYTTHGLTVSRPDGWRFVPPDDSVARDTVVILQGPSGDAILAPAVEVSMRALTAQDQRRKPTDLVNAVVMEMIQTMAGMTIEGQPEELQMAGHPAARLRLTYTEQLPDGQEVERAASFYGIVDGQRIWVLRCMGPQDRSAEPQFEQVLASLQMQPR